MTRAQVAAGLLLGRVVLVPRSSNWVLRRLDGLAPSLGRFWMTFRLPFMRTRIFYPDIYSGTNIVANQWQVLAHELVHVRQFAPWYGPAWLLLLYVLVPLPVVFSGRWFIERPAYLQDIKLGRHTSETAADALWRAYVWPWPRGWMRVWFEERK